MNAKPCMFLAAAACHFSVLGGNYQNAARLQARSDEISEIAAESPRSAAPIGRVSRADAGPFSSDSQIGDEYLAFRLRTQKHGD
jgi:hypothetical protein